MAGKFIVLEGPDGSGTTRQSQLLTEHLRNRGETVVLTAEPTESAIGKEIRRMLSGDTLPSPDAVQLLFTADRANHVATVIAPALRAGKTVVCDRYAISTVIYGTALGLDADWLTQINSRFPQPDLTIVTLPPFDVCVSRLEKRKESDQFETTNFQRRVYEGYKSIEDTRTLFVDTSGEKHQTAEYILQQVDRHFSVDQETSTADLGTLES